MSKSVRAVLAVLLFLLAILGIMMVRRIVTSQRNQISEKTQHLIRSMRNEDVIWDGNFLGVMPVKLEGSTLELRDSSEDINSSLIDALQDPNRFVAAHVLLTLRTSETGQISASQWNGLKVQLLSNGETSFDSNNLMELQKRWKRRLFIRRP